MSRHLTRALTKTLHRAAYENTHYPIASRALISRAYCHSKPPPTPKSKPIETTSTPITPASTTSTSTATPTTEAVEKGNKEPTPTIPDVQSTGLGLEDPEDDPKKWQKFAWKYLGSLVVFAIAYKTVGWYADSLEKEGKLKREEVEERKLAREEYEAEKLEMERNIEQVKKENERLQALQEQTPVVPSLSDPVTPIQETVGFISELDQLRAYRKDLVDEMNGVDVNAERKKDIVEELDQLDLEIGELTK